MPTISQLPPAGPPSPTDEVALWQGSQTYSATLSLLLGGLQPLITMSSGTLLGRCGAGDGGVELVVPALGLQLSGGNLAATGADHTTFGLLPDLTQVQEVIANSDGHPCRVPLAALRTLYSAGPNVAINATGQISVAQFLPGTGAPAAGYGVQGDIYLDTTCGALWLCNGASWSLTGGTILGLISSLSGSGNTAAAVDLLPANGASVSVSVPAQQSLIRVTGTAVAQDVASGDSIVWDIAAATKRVGTSATAQLVGTPSISVFAADSSMQNCGLYLGTQQGGCVLSGVGLAGQSINWSATLVVTTCG